MMMRYQHRLLQGIALVAVLGLLTSCGFRRKKYENPITKNTQQPDKVLFDKAIHDIEHGRYEVARLTLNTLVNTYDSSEFLAKAKLAIADSWYREGGAHGLAQAEAEYKDFILFYPTMEEAAEAQQKVCMIHYKQMEKPDRDSMQARRADEECRQVLVQFPNSKFAPQAAQVLRDIQEVLAEAEFRTGTFYHKKGSYAAAASRLQGLTNQYPLYSKADEALWELGDSWGQMGSRFRTQSGEAYARIVKDYPLSPLVEQAKKRLTALELPIPEADPVALARMKYELENREKIGLFSHAFGIFKRGPETRAAAKSGTPAMTTLRPAVPPSVPAPAGATGVTGDVTVQTVTDSSVLDSKPDARQNPPTDSASASQTTSDSSKADSSSAASSGQQATPQKDNKKKKNSKK
jgi:outer membrane protein assembly factor BamD